jgi:hypothetical protein
MAELKINKHKNIKMGLTVGQGVGTMFFGWNPNIFVSKGKISEHYDNPSWGLNHKKGIEKY